MPIGDFNSQIKYERYIKSQNERDIQSQYEFYLLKQAKSFYDIGRRASK